MWGRGEGFISILFCDRNTRMSRERERGGLGSAVFEMATAQKLRSLYNEFPLRVLCVFFRVLRFVAFGADISKTI